MNLWIQWSIWFKWEEAGFNQVEYTGGGCCVSAHLIDGFEGR